MFGTWFAAAWTTFTLSMLGMTLGTVRFMFPNVLSEPPSTFKAATPKNHLRPEHDLHAPGLHAQLARRRKEVQVPLPRLRLQDHRRQLRRPGPRPLERYAIKKTDDGQIIVDKSRKFQKELGQWDDPDSFIIAVIVSGDVIRRIARLVLRG